MKNLGPLLVLGFLLLAGIGLFLLVGPFAEKPGMRAVYDNYIGQDTRSKQSLPAQPSKGPVSAAEADAGTPARDAGGADQPSASKPGEARGRFPTAADLPNGMERPRLMALFGPPNMRTVSVDQGAQLETLVYIRKEPGAATFVLLRAGRVVSATTTSY